MAHPSPEWDLRVVGELEAEQDLVVKLPQSIVDVLHPLLFATELPEEWAPPVVTPDDGNVESSDPAEQEANSQQTEESVIPMPEGAGEIE